MFPILMSNYLRCLTNKTVVSVAGCDGTFSHGRATQPAHSPPVFCSNLLVSISSYYHRAFQSIKKKWSDTSYRTLFAWRVNQVDLPLCRQSTRLSSLRRSKPSKSRDFYFARVVPILPSPTLLATVVYTITYQHDLKYYSLFTSRRLPLSLLRKVV